MVIYKLSDIVGKPLAKDRKAFGVVNDVGTLTFRLMAFPVFNINGESMEGLVVSAKPVPKFFICCSKYYGPNFEKKRFIFESDGVFLRTCSVK